MQPSTQAITPQTTTQQSGPSSSPSPPIPETPPPPPQAGQMADPVVRLTPQEVRRRAESDAASDATPETGMTASSPTSSSSSSSTVAQSVASTPSASGTQTGSGGDGAQVRLSPSIGDGQAATAAPGAPTPSASESEVAEQEGGEEISAEQAAADEAAAGETAPKGEVAAEGEGGDVGGGEGARTPGGEEGEAAGGEGAAPSVELHMPPPPSGLSEQEESRVQSVQSRASSAAETTADLPPAQDTVEGTREAVTQPEEETEARAQAGVVASLEEREDPSPEIEELCKAIRRSIREKRPVSEDELVEADPEDMAQEAGEDLNENVEGEAQRVQGQYDAMQEPPSGESPPPGGPVETPAESVDTPAVNATEATPDGVPAEDVSLDEDVEAQQQRMDEAGMTTEPAQLVQDGPIADANDAQGELEQTAQEAPAEVLARQDERLNAAREEMAELQAQAQERLSSARADTAGRVGAQQFDMVGSEEEMRAAASQRAEAIFTQAQNDVNAQLDPLSDVAMGMWEAGVERASTEFRQSLDRVEAWIEERYEGVGGAISQLGDAVFGMPAWVTEEYDRAETKFGDDVCELIREISSEVNTVIANCEQIIADARQDIDDLFNSLPDELQAWAETQKTQFGERLDQLEAQAHQARDDFNQDLQQRAVQAVEEVQAEVEALREKARGLVGQIAAAIGEFLENPARAILNGLLTLVGIPPPRFWAVVDKIGQVISDIADDPLGFASNLLDALRQGFNQFFGNIGSHLLDGLMEWLFQGLGSVGVEIPSDFSLQSIITFFLQLMGITWERIRGLLAKHIGEENVALIEKAYELISVLIEKGPEGIFEMIKDRLNPQEILQQVLDAAIDYLIEVLITKVTARIIALFNPAGAIVQAVEAIYRVLKWVFEKAAQIFSLVETVVNGMADIVAGNVGGLASAIEQALAGLIAPVIDFFADYIGLGGLPDKIAEVIGSLQDWVEGILDKVIGFLADKAKALLSRLGLGSDEDDADSDEESDYDGQIGERLTWNSDESHHMRIAVDGGTPVLVMASDTEQPVVQHINRYRDVIRTKSEEGALADEERDTLLVMCDSAETLATSIIPKAKQAYDSVEADDTRELKRLDDDLERKQTELRNLLAKVQSDLDLEEGLSEHRQEQLDMLKAYFGNDLFNSSEAGRILSVTTGTARGILRDFIDEHSLLYDYRSGAGDPRTAYTFDASKAGRRETSSDQSNRRKYGYVNPKKDSSKGKQILSKGKNVLRNVVIEDQRYDAVSGVGFNAYTPQPIEPESTSYHKDEALYDNQHPEYRSTRGFRYPNAILGHDADMGASDHWNSIGHTQTRSANMAWNKNPDNYHGPEDKANSAASGSDADPYYPPIRGESHPSWFS